MKRLAIGAMSATLIKSDRISEIYLGAALEMPLPDKMLEIVASGEKSDTV